MTIEIKRKPLEYYLALQYPVTIEAAPEGGYFIEISALHGCYSQGETIEEAIKNIEEARQLWIEVAYEEGVDIPLPEDKEYSGTIIVRGPKNLHRRLDQLADREGVSLNQYIVSTLSHATGVAESHKKYRAGKK